MPQTNFWRTDRPDEGDSAADAAFAGLPVRTVLPDRYEPGYPYPLLVAFHGRGQNEDQILRMAPRVSGQNFVYLSLRGPERLGSRANGRPAFGWDRPDAATMYPEYVRLAVQLTRSTYHIHSERVYLLGANEGAEAAFRAAFGLAGQIAGVIALNGLLPRPHGKPVFTAAAARGLRVFLGRSLACPGLDVRQADRDYTALYGVGADVHARTYPTHHRLPADMLRDVNRWIIGNVNAEHDLYAVR